MRGGKAVVDGRRERLITSSSNNHVVCLVLNLACRWVFAFQRSVALAMTKIMMAQANSSMHHSLGTNDDTLRQHDADEALFLQEAAINDDDGWDTRRLTRTRNIMDGHANVINSIKEGGGGTAAGGARVGRHRSMSIDYQTSPGLQQAQESVATAAAAAAAALRVRTYKDRSFGDLTRLPDEKEAAGAVSTPSSPLVLSWGRSLQVSKLATLAL